MHFGISWSCKAPNTLYISSSLKFQTSLYPQWQNLKRWKSYEGEGSVASCQEICKPFYLMCTNQANANTPDETCPPVAPHYRNSKSHPVIYQSLCYLKGVTGFYLAPDISFSFVAASQVACVLDETTTYLCVTNLLPLLAPPPLPSICLCFSPLL